MAGWRGWQQLTNVLSNVADRANYQTPGESTHLSGSMRFISPETFPIETLCLSARQTLHINNAKRVQAIPIRQVGRMNLAVGQKIHASIPTAPGSGQSFGAIILYTLQQTRKEVEE